MTEPKEAPLNGAYYGPVIPPPPPQPHYRRPWCSAITTFGKLIIAMSICLGIIALVVWLVVRPSDPKFYVVPADLTQFNLTNGNTLSYNLSLNMAVRNPNRKIGFYYDRLLAEASYDGEIFGRTSLSTPFYQGHKNTTIIRPTFVGQSVIKLGKSGVDKFNSEKISGVLSIDIKLNGWVRAKIGSIKDKYRPKIECELRIPLASSNGTTAAIFETQECDVDF